MPISSEHNPLAPRILWATALAGAALAALAFLFALSQRLLYPYELEWMEGALVDHASRIANGLPLYCEPSPEHVPFLYAPLLFWLGGIAMKLGCDGLLTLRLIATVSSLGIALLVGHWVRRETGRVVVGLVASGLFVGGYGWLAWWYDLARNDSLFVLPCLASAYVLRHGGQRRWLLAAALATAAFLAKQTALMWLPAIAVGALCLDWRNGLRYLGASVIGIGAFVGAMHIASDGWSTFWIFEMPQHHAWNTQWILGYWTEGLLPIVPLLLLGLVGLVTACRAGHLRDALFLAAFGGGGLVTSWLSLLHVGGFDNVLAYAFCGACVLGPLATAADGRVMRIAGPLLLFVQLAMLGYSSWLRDPLRTLLPHPSHRRAHDELLGFVRSQPGPVWIPGHGGLGLRVGRGTSAHGQAIFDLLQLLPKLPDGMLDLGALTDRSKLADLSPRGQEAVAGFLERSIAALRERRFVAVVVDEVGTPLFPALFAAGLDGWVRAPGALLREPAALRPLIGFEVHSPYALVPRR